MVAITTCVHGRACLRRMTAFRKSLPVVLSPAEHYVREAITELGGENDATTFVFPPFNFIDYVQLVFQFTNTNVRFSQSGAAGQTKLC